MFNNEPLEVIRDQAIRDWLKGTGQKGPAKRDQAPKGTIPKRDLTQKGPCPKGNTGQKTLNNKFAGLKSL